MTLDAFEESLLTELRQHVSDRAPGAAPRRRTAVALVASGAAAAVTAAIAIAIGTGVVVPASAYAIQAQQNGDLVVTVNDLSDASGLEGALAAHGVDATVSYQSEFSQSAGQSPTATGGPACDITLAKVDGGLRFTLDRRQVARGGQLHIVTSGSTPRDVGSPVEVAWFGGGC
jgi:hypothetical protein